MRSKFPINFSLENKGETKGTFEHTFYHSPCSSRVPRGFRDEFSLPATTKTGSKVSRLLFPSISSLCSLSRHRGKSCRTATCCYPSIRPHDRDVQPFPLFHAPLNVYSHFFLPFISRIFLFSSLSQQFH